MIIVPRENPVIHNLNSYYLDFEKLLEHYQRELGSGAVQFKSTSSQAVVFFDKQNILNGTFQTNTGKVDGRNAIDRLKESLSGTNYTVTVYRIDPHKINFWANLQNVEEYYKNLSTEFTHLEGLIKKMSSEMLTGFIEVSIGGGEEGGQIFFDHGAIVGSFCSWEKGELNRSKDNLELLILKSKELGGTFNVNKIFLENRKEGISPEKLLKETPPDRLDMIQELLIIFEKLVRSNKKIKAEFDTLLKRKFMEKVDEYDFLDPFTAEFQYAKGKIIYAGTADVELISKGVMECVKELADELEIQHQFPKYLVDWAQRYSKEIAKYNLEF